MSFEFNIDWEEHLSSEEDLRAAASKVLFLSMNKFVQIASSIVSDNTNYTGALAQGIVTSLDPKVEGSDTYTVSDGVAYGKYVNDGTSNHWVPIDPLKEWAKMVLGDENAAYAVQKTIAAKGTEPLKFWDLALLEVQEKWIPYYSEVVTR